MNASEAERAGECRRGEPASQAPAQRCLATERGGRSPPRVKTPPQQRPPRQKLRDRPDRVGPPVPSTSAPGRRPGLSSPPKGQRRGAEPKLTSGDAAPALPARSLPLRGIRCRWSATGGTRREPAPSTGALALRPSAPQALPDGTHHRVRQPPSARPMRSVSTIPSSPGLSRPFGQPTRPSQMSPVTVLQGGASSIRP